MEVSRWSAEEKSDTDRILPGVSELARISSHRVHSVYRLAHERDVGNHGCGIANFSPEGYSLFKHGDERWTRRYGYAVADLLLEVEADFFDAIRFDGVLIASFPYKYVPTAAALMTDHTVTRLNHELAIRDKPTVGHLHVFKYPWQASGEHYFAHMEEPERRHILDNVKLSVDEDRLYGAHLIVIDDIRVTGATEDKFLELLYRVDGLRSLTVVYLAEIDPAVAEMDPAIEGRLNQYKVKNLDDIREIAAGEFRWNIRVAKFVLEQDDAERFSALVHDLSDEVLLAFYRMTTLNDYHLEPKYAHHFQAVRSAVEARGLV